MPRIARPFSIAHRVVSNWTQSPNRAIPSPSASVVFLGTPTVAATVLETLLEKRRDCGFEVAAVVSQPNRPVGRKNRKIPSPTPVSALALDRGFVPEASLLTPESAKDEGFLRRVAELKPDLCITAGYGNLLPQGFLEIPRYGTLNIHPSLLPTYRGAAPVARALEDGVQQTGVSIAYTVKQMDAGPILISEKIDVDPDIQAPELLTELFEIGTKLLLDALPSVLNETATYTAQNPKGISHAPKLVPEESLLDFQSPALELHNKVRAFVPWPGTRGRFKLFNSLNSTFQDLELRIIKTRIPDDHPDFLQGICFLNNERLLLQCGQDTVLEVLSLQKPGGKVLGIKDFKNGISKRQTLTLG